MDIPRSMARRFPEERKEGDANPITMNRTARNRKIMNSRCFVILDSHLIVYTPLEGLFRLRKLAGEGYSTLSTMLRSTMAALVHSSPTATIMEITLLSQGR
jgi:hypothetical protein